VVGWRVCKERDEATFQAILDESPQAVWYYSDLYATYKTLIYKPGVHTAMPDKSETYRVEGVNAELRHYLARLARKSRCFSRCIHALQRAVKLFVFAWNRRQLYRQQYPNYPSHLIDFVYP
jgi:insertion element IS1 protein InsB